MPRDLAADLRICEAAPEEIEPYVTDRGGVVIINGPFPLEKARACKAFIEAAREAWPEAIRRAMEAERRVAELEAAIREECAGCPRDGKGLSGRCWLEWCPLYPYRAGASAEEANRQAQIEESRIEGCGEEG